MKKKLRVLIIEDSEDDTLLEVKQLEREGYKVEYLRVDASGALDEALEKKKWDVVLSDFTMPGFGGLEALAAVRKKSRYLPFIFVSGTIGEDRAVEAMRNGANDYVLKDNLKRLAPSIERELRDMELRERSDKAEAELHNSEERFRLLAEASHEGIAFHDGGILVRANDQYFRLFGYKPDELIGKDVIELTIAPESRDFVRKQVREKATGPYEAIGLRSDGTKFPLESRARLMSIDGREVRVASILDVTGRKHAEDTLRLQVTALEAAANSIVITDSEGNIRWVNKAFTNLTGYSFEDIVGKTPRILKSGTQPSHFYKELWKTILAGKVWHGELVNRRKNGVLYNEEMTITPVRGSSGKIVNFIAVKQDVTERKLYFEALKKRELGLKEAQRVAKLGNWELDHKTKKLEWSDEIFRIFEIDPAEFGASYEAFLDLIHPDDRSLVDRAFTDSLKSRKPYQVVHRLLLKDRGIKYIRERCETSFDKEGRAVRSIGTIQDITEQMAADEALRKSEEKYRTLFESVPIAIASTNLAGEILSLNPWFKVITGKDDNEWLGKPFDGLALPEDIPVVAEAVRKICLEKAPAAAEVRFVKANGQIGFVELRGTPTIENGEVTGLVGFGIDITERKNAEREKDSLMQRLSLATELSRIGVWDLDLSCMSAECDRRVAEMFGMPAPRAISLEEWRNFVVAEDFEKTQDAIRRVMETGEAQLLEFRIKRSDGNVSYLECGIGSMNDPESKTTHVIGVALDVTERRLAIEKIREQAALLNESRDAISAMDLALGIVFWNKGAEELYGWKAGEVLGKTQYDLSVEKSDDSDTSGTGGGKPEGRSLPFTDTAHRDAFDATLAGGKWKGELREKTRSGKEIVVLSRWTLISDDAGKPKSILFISTDITEQKAMEAQYRRAQRMETLGTLASGIAHDLNNVLTPITLALEILQRKYPDDEKTTKLLTTIESTVNRGTGVVKQILAFARGGESKREPVDASVIIEDMKRIMEETFPKNIESVVYVEPGTGLIIADKTQMHQVLMNLCVNARDAMPTGGRIKISANSVKIDEQYAKMSDKAKQGDFFVIEVSDTGTGIRKENLPKLFEPFFTTKDSGKGTGLGLAIVQGIVESHGGFIEVVSELKKGTTFRVYLPSGIPTEPTISPEAENAVRLGNGELIIVADDEGAVREITRTTLETYGYRVMDAGDGSEAVALFAQHADDVALVLTDLVMPVMDGPATIRALRKMKPDVKIVAATGYTDETRYFGLLDTLNGVLKKPYTANALMKIITQALGNLSAVN